MVNISDETAVTMADIAKWYQLNEQLSELKAAESMLRSRLFKHFFQNPTEGEKENKYPLNDGTGAILQGNYVINRKVNEGELEALKAAIKEEGSNLPKLPLTKLIKWKPEVAITEYKKLSDEDRAVFDRCLEIKPGMPGLKVVIPKRGV